MASMTYVEKPFNWAIRVVPSTAFYPIYWLKNRLFPTRTVPVLNYHRVNPRARGSVTPASFEQQIRWLKKQDYHFISLREYFSGKDQGHFWKQKKVVITFDDGYEDNYLYAFPILKHYGAKCTIFVSTYYVEHRCVLPWYHSEPRAYEDFRMLSWKQIEDMSDYGIEFGSHTVTHADLTRLNDSELGRELIESRQTIEDHTGHVAFLCYPFGRYNQRVITMASEVGYQGACSCIHGRNSKDTPVFELRRVYVSTTLQTPFEFHKKMMGAYDFPMFLYQLFLRM